MPAPRLRQAVVALAAIFIVSIVTTQRPASASRPSSDASDLQDVELPQPQSGLRRLVSFVRGQHAATSDGVGHRVLAQVAKPASATNTTAAAKPTVAAALVAKPTVAAKPAGKALPKAAPKNACSGKHKKLCGGKCVDVSYDRNNCGDCNKRCGINQVCDSGVIRFWPMDDEPCPAGYQVCRNQCVNFLTDADNCGSCRNPCGEGQYCDAGVCKSVITPAVAAAAKGKKVALPATYSGRGRCQSNGRSCYYSFANSNNNCGRCGVRCPPDACCERGVCKCRRKRCLCRVGTQLKCLKPGEYCPSDRKTCPIRCRTKWCGQECCASKWDVCYDSNFDYTCDKCCPLQRFSQKLNKCCPVDYVPCTITERGVQKPSCCPACPAALCDTAAGKVCCPQKQPGTTCQTAPGEKNDQCCATALCQTGATSYQCCASTTQCKKAAGATYSTCCPTGQVCGDTCCPVGAQCYDDDGNTATPTKCCPSGSTVYPATAAAAKVKAAVATGVKQVCCPKGQTGYTDTNNQPACCAGKLYPSDAAPGAQQICCPATQTGYTDATNKLACCAGVVCGNNCCPAGAQCYNDDVNPATSTKCCPSGNSVFPANPQLNTTKQVCCPSGQSGYRPGSEGEPDCCDSGKLVGDECCPITPAVCGDTSKKCCAADEACKTDGSGAKFCCKDSQWTGSTCCPDDKEPAVCTGGPLATPPTICCDSGVECQYNENPNPSDPTQPIGYACITGSCGPLPTHCTDATDFITDPSCCCKACDNGFVPQCPADASGDLEESCNEPGGAGCGCKCTSGVICNTGSATNETCCTSSTATCYDSDGSDTDATKQCCESGNVYTAENKYAKCCATAENGYSDGSGNPQCCPVGSLPYPTSPGSGIKQACCNTTTENGYYTDFPTNKTAGCCPKDRVVCGNTCCASGKQGCIAGVCTECDADSDCTGGKKCCAGTCVAAGNGNHGANCCTPNSNFTACAGGLACSNSTGPGTCGCDDNPAQETYCGNNNQCCLNNATCYDNSGDGNYDSCCASGSSVFPTSTGGGVSQSCCSSGTYGYYTNSPTNTTTDCCPNAQIVCGNTCCPSGQLGCIAGVCTGCDADSDCSSGQKCCAGQCVANGNGNHGANCCTPNSNFTACAGGLACSNSTGPGTCVCDDNPAGEQYCGNNNQCCPATNQCYDGSGDGTFDNCCAAGTLPYPTSPGSSVKQACCNTTTENGYLVNSTAAGCCPKSRVVCGNTCCAVEKQGCIAGVCTECDADSDCTGGKKCCAGTCVAAGNGNHGASCCGVTSSITPCAGGLKCSSTSGGGNCVCDDNPAGEQYCGNNNQCCPATNQCYDGSGDGTFDNCCAAGTLPYPTSPGSSVKQACCNPTTENGYLVSSTAAGCCPKSQLVCSNTCCPAGKNACVSGVCKDCSSDSQCTGGKICCGNACVSPSSDTTCGGCNACPPNKQCTNSGGTNQCVCKQASPYNAACDASGGCNRGYTCDLSTCTCILCNLVPADVYFLADNTGSMGDIINAVKNGAGQILSSLNSSVTDLRTGGGRYRDRRDSFVFQNTANLGVGTSGAQSAINAWAASGGFDEPEGQLYALWKLATGSYGWRPSASKIIVWFGDAPGHNPICKNYAGTNDPPSSVSLDDVKNSLASAGIKVLALSVGANRLDLAFGSSISTDNICAETYPQPNQATVLTTGTGGQLYSGVQVNTIVQVIIDSVQNATCPGTTSRFAAIAAAGFAALTTPEPLPIGDKPATN